MITKNEQLCNAMEIFQYHGVKSALRHITAEPDWEGSETLISESWKNPLLTMQMRLQIADGAYAFQEKVIDNLRTRIKVLEVTLAKVTISRCESCKYNTINGDIGERCITCKDFSNWEPK